MFLDSLTKHTTNTHKVQQIYIKNNILKSQYFVFDLRMIQSKDRNVEKGLKFRSKLVRIPLDAGHHCSGFSR